MSKIIQFIAEVVAEFKNISWPKKDALIELTIVVISISLIVSLVLGSFDYLFTQGFNLLGAIKNPPTQSEPLIETIISPIASPSVDISPTVNLKPTK